MNRVPKRVSDVEEVRDGTPESPSILDRQDQAIGTTDGHRP